MCTLFSAGSLLNSRFCVVSFPWSGSVYSISAQRPARGPHLARDELSCGPRCPTEKRLTQIRHRHVKYIISLQNLLAYLTISVTHKEAEEAEEEEEEKEEERRPAR